MNIVLLVIILILFILVILCMASIGYLQGRVDALEKRPLQTQQSNNLKQLSECINEQHKQIRMVMDNANLAHTKANAIAKHLGFKI